MKKLFLFLILSVSLTGTFAQKSAGNNEELKMKAYLKIRELFNSSIDRTAFRDTNQILSFALKVDVVKKGKNVSYTQIVVTDDYAYRLFKNFDFLSGIDYKVFLGKRKEATFVFPIAIALVHPEKKNPGLVLAEDVLKNIVPFLSINDGNGKLNPVYNYIYIPAITIITSTNEDV